MKNLTLLLSLLLAYGLAHGQLAVENFDYGAGTALSGAGAAGDGWAGPWTYVSESTLGTVQAGSITAAGQTGTDGHLAFEYAGGADTRYYRQLAERRTDVAGESEWMSMFISTEIDGDPLLNGSVHFMGFADAGTYGSGGRGGQLMFLGRQFNQADFAAVRISLFR